MKRFLSAWRCAVLILSLAVFHLGHMSLRPVRQMSPDHVQICRFGNFERDA